ncbi:type ii and iii secretion system protein : Type II and III secretion system protein OS=Pirellula staleyi (strain ATCC 27377 / DSM 6068 / ICPB 4128) GN=Psta_1186 PE=4 SV=1: T2SS-T3SS_pil_N: Secretin [Gemmataceae bacterium]|nr:type ii and iii secretion system protein : Type II and III secretion system protein OS=Pirellula staleyi (strain ATCC 27377 / DSM 6068 / ICPB 4128) GN=Psta_1186 PE=4 SV=1: T2SS-T3SS_pil_N: Secretin [Gemmataceae bacterium]VTT99716.1 type ii and iii secretion system protein : Type II and III secretion system protein OS=Pirellula staleyi (strain ATCC 27377 / DSM 6068 / ICPB 4128) GN=Psta_1186 PE=4 SV=1: T2SS-T3SS_pil_N: Secretin [Gemmataceae bacterium]
MASDDTAAGLTNAGRTHRRRGRFAAAAAVLCLGLGAVLADPPAAPGPLAPAMPLPPVAPPPQAQSPQQAAKPNPNYPVIVRSGGISTMQPAPTSTAPAQVTPAQSVSAPGAPHAVTQAATTAPKPISAPPTGGVRPVPVPPPGASQPNPLPLPVVSSAAEQPAVGATPKTTQATREKMAKYVAKLIDPETTLDLVVGQSRVLVFKDAPFRIQTGNEQVLSFNPATPRELLLQGKAVGATVLTLWFGDRNDPAKQETLSYLVRIFPDPDAKDRVEKAYKALEDDINKHFRDTSVRLKVLGDKLVVSGRVRDFVQGGQILQIIRSNPVVNPNAGPVNGAGAGGEDAGKIPIVPAGGFLPDAIPPAQPMNQEAFQAAGGPNVINLLEVAGEQQVMLRVIVAEVNRAAARSIGMNFAVQNNQGLTVFANATGLLTGFTGIGGSTNLLGAGPPNVFARFDAGRVPVAIKALKSLQYAKSLAEPTLVTMNGQTADFRAGGQFPVPVIGGFNGLAGGLQGVSYVPFGVQLSFTPFVTDRDKVRLVLSANVSNRDTTTGTTIGGAAVPGMNTRNVNTTVELRQGETLAVAGLIETSLSGDRNSLPFIGDIPGLNVLTGLQRVQATERELVIFITPELARPMDPGQTPALPGCEILDPSDVELYLMGRIEGHCRDFRSPIRTDLSRIRMYSRTEAVNVAGPSGYTPLP